MTTRYVMPEPKKHTAGEQVKDTLIYLIVAGTIYYIIVLIARVVTAPFRILFMTDKQRFQARLDKDRAKIKARRLMRAAFDASEANPMYQYLLRFKYSPEQFKNDPDNGFYKSWFEDLKKGTLLDTHLVWAPDVYGMSVVGTRMMNESFLDYFSQQFDLHENASLGDKIRFMGTIRKFYPEFTPKFSVIPSELADLRARLQSRKLHNELLEVISGSGVPLDLAESLVNKDMSSAEIKASIRVMQKCLARKYGKAMCQFCVKHNFNPDLHEDYFSDAVNNILEHTQNEEMALALIRGDMGPEEIDTIVKKAMVDFGSRQELLSNVRKEFRRAMKSKTLMGR